MTEQNILDVFNNLSLIIFLKPLSIFILGAYIIFSLLIVKQVGLMTNFMASATTPLIRVLAWVNLIVALIFLVFIILFV